MKQKYFLSGWVCWMIGSSIFLSSCFYYGPVVPDPYIVSDYRQKENLYYIPSSPTTPLLTEKNDISMTATRLADTKFTGGEVQAAFMPGKKTGIMGSYFSARNDAGYTKYNRFEVGAGYVKGFSKKLHFETYAGFGSGKISNIHYIGQSKLKATHFFIQPAFAVGNKKKTVQFSFVSRFEGVNFKVSDTTFNNDREPFTTSQIKSLYDQPFHVMWQPGFVFKLGWKKILFHSGYSYSSDLTNPDLHRATGNFSLGIILRLNTSESNVVNLDK